VQQGDVMTLSNQTKKVTATGNGVATTFSFSPIVVFSSSDLVVVTTEIATGIETERSEGTGSTNWSIAITDFTNEGTTGSITYPADTVTPLPSTHTITIKRKLTIEQSADLDNQHTATEIALDKLAMIGLQQQEEIDRSFVFPVSYTGSVSTTLPAPVAGDGGKILALNSGLTAFEYLTPNTSTYLSIPASSTDNGVVRFSGTAGNTFQNSGVTIDDSDNLDVPGALTLGAVLAVAEGGTGSDTASGAFDNLKQTATTSATGVVEKSTSGENTGGTATDKFPDVAGVKEMIDTHAGGLTGFRNRIINGDGTVNQLGAQTALSDTDYFVDKWQYLASNDAVVNGDEVSSFIEVDVTTADATIAAGQYALVTHKIEADNITDFLLGAAGAATVTLSFKHKHTKTGTYCVAFRNSATDRNYIFEYTQSVSDTEETHTETVTLDTTGS